MFKPKLSGKRINLKLLEPTEENARAVCSVIRANRNWLHHYLPGIVIQADTPKKAYDWLTHSAGLARDNMSACYYIFQKSEIIGQIRALNGREYREVIYWIDERHSGKGFIKEAFKILEKELFTQNKLPILLRIEEDNQDSMRVAQSVGFTKTPFDIFVKSYQDFMREPKCVTPSPKKRTKNSSRERCE